MWDMRFDIGARRTPASDILRARTLHLAEGVLIALRKCRAEAALAELMEVARGAALSPYAVAAALVSVAAGDVAADPGDPAVIAVHERWSADLGRIAGLTV